MYGQQSVPGLRVSPHGELKAAKRNQKGECPEKTVARTPAAEESHIPGLICNQDGQRASSAATVTPVDAPGQHVPKHEVIGTADGHDPGMGNCQRGPASPRNHRNAPAPMKAFPSTAAAPLAEPPTIIDRRFITQVWREPRDVGEE